MGYEAGSQSGCWDHCFNFMLNTINVWNGIHLENTPNVAKAWVGGETFCDCAILRVKRGPVIDDAFTSPSWSIADSANIW